MTEKNYEYLSEQLMRTGFGDTLNDELRKNMEKQNADFTLNLQQAYGTDKVSATLHFKKSPESDMYFFNKYDLQLKKEEQENTINQTFYPNKNITLKEGYNLLDGRAVHKILTSKEDEKYAAWLQLDFTKNTQSGNYEFKQFHQNYGFDLEKTLSKYPIKELGNEKYKEALIRSLERGNLQSATFQINGKEEKIYIAPNLTFKTLNAYSSGMQKISVNELIQKNKQEQSNKQEVKEDVSGKQQMKKQAKVNKEETTPIKRMRKKHKIG